MSALGELAAAADETLRPYAVADPGPGSFESRVPDPNRAFVIEAVGEREILRVIRYGHVCVAALTRSADPNGGLGVRNILLAYCSSKSALNMITIQYAKAFPQMRINAVDPGYTATDFNEHRGTKPVEQGAEIIVRMAKVDGSGPTGTFVDENGTVPW